MTSTPTFHNPTEAKQFAAGLAIVRQKLAGRRQPTAAEVAARTFAAGKAIIARKFTPEAFRKTFGHLPPRTMAPATTATSTRKSYSTEAGPFSPPKLHRYVTKGLFA
ncbi:MAG: hypothetical protein NTW21_39580 [Verrucomicrobia bacterium]|nr:hypothetical protein [Verrucomicrobiota bacterium]